jgi:hypothetical protein
MNLRKLFFGFSLLICLQLNAQNYLISFEGKGESNSVSSVFVENLNAGTSLTLNGRDILNLTFATGIKPILDFQPGFRIYPNPMVDNSTLEFFPPVAGNAMIIICDLTGKPLAQVKGYFEKSRQDFKLSGLKNGLYLIKIAGDGYRFSGKLMSNVESNGTISIEKVINNTPVINVTKEKRDIKGDPNTIEMEYSPGETLRFTGFSGDYSNEIIVIPESSEIITFNFIGIPSLTTSSPIATSSTTAISGGTVIADGSASVTARGICWALTPFPNINDNLTSNGSGTGVFTSNLTGLQPVTTYYVRAYATNSAGTAYGDDLTFTTPAVLPSLTTTAASSITRTTATSGGNITSDGEASVETRGICWSTSPNPSVAGSHTNDGTTNGSFTSEITGLLPGTLYYIRAYASNSAGTAYGNELSFTTYPVIIATVSTTFVTSITSTTAVSGGNITSDGDGTVTARGICWATTSSPTITNNVTSNGTGTGSFTSNITGLQPGITYHVRAYATNSAGTAYGNDRLFTTPAVLPSISTTAASGITRTAAVSGGIITSDGGAAITSSGICWSTSSNPSIAGSHTSDGSTTGSYTSGMTGLLPGTIYYIRAYATNSVGTAYGNERSFITNPVIIATLTTNAVTSITSGTAVSGGNITGDGDGTVSKRGICWATTSSPTVNDNLTSNGTGTGSFTSNLTGLQPGTTYHIRAYATNSAGTAYGDDLTFTTLAILPSLTTSAASGITRTTANSGGNITSNGGAAIETSGICWSTSHSPSIAGSHTSDGSSAGSFTSSITGLLPGTLYYVRAYAVNSVGTAYGNESSFTTNPVIVATLSTTAVSSITSVTAVSGGNITSDGDGAITSRGICWATSSSPTINNNFASNGTGTGSFTGNLTGLLPVTTYHVRAYATNSAGTAYGNDLSFTTLAVLPSLTTSGASAISRTTATSGGNITSNGGAIVITSGICWSTSHSPSIAGSHTSDGTAIGRFTSKMTGLLPGTLYYIRVYATNSIGTAYGNERSFRTSPVVIATLTTNAVSSITSTTAVSGGNITSDGDGTVTARGICWATTSSPTITNNVTSDGTGTGSFTSNLAGLQPGITYHVRAYATNSAGTAYGSDRSFTTPAILPSITTTAASGITRTAAVSGGNITSDGGAAITSSGICWSTSPNPSITGSHTSDGTATGSFTSSMTALLPGTLYYIRAYATNSAGTAYGNELSFTTNPVIISTLTTTAISSITSATAVSGGNITSDGDGPITARGICWATTSSPTVNDNLTSNGTGTGSFTSNLTGLLPATTYHVRAYATNSAGTAYGNDRSFTTLALLPSLTTTVITGVTRSSAISGGNISSDGGSAVITSGICWSTSPNPSITGSHTSDGTTSGSFTSSMTVLLPGTLYYVRAYATSSVGTAYGNELSFTTDPVIIATITTTAISSITSATAVSGGNITSDGGGSVTARGICWSTTSSPTINNNFSSNGTGTGSFTSNLTGLQPGTTYHVRAYATNSAGTAYGNEVIFITNSVTTATLTTAAVSVSSPTSATSGGTITNDGGSTITARGVCWATSSSPTISDNFTSNGTGTGSFTSNLSGLLPATTYHVRAYATNGSGTAYGNELVFNTNSAGLATITTTAVTISSTTSAITGGNISNDGGGTITARGVCWSTTPSPTIADNLTSNGTGAGSFTSNLTGLLPATTYHVRAYATNIAGTAYGADIKFTTVLLSINPVISACKWLNDSPCFLNLSFDDGQAAHLKISNMLDQFGFKGTFYIETRELGHPELMVSYNTIASNGHEIGSHTVNHLDLTSLSESDLNYEIDESVNAINSNLHTTCSSFAHPFDITNDYINSVIFSKNLFTRNISEYYANPRPKIGLTSDTQLSEVTSFIDAQIAANSTCLIAGHGIDNSGYSPMTTQFFTDLLTYIKTVQTNKKVWVTTMSNGALYESLFYGVTLTTQIDQSNQQIRIQFNYPDKPIYNKFNKLLFSFKINKSSSWSIQNSGIEYIETDSQYIYTIDLKQAKEVTLQYVITQ